MDERLSNSRRAVRSVTLGFSILVAVVLMSACATTPPEHPAQAPALAGDDWVVVSYAETTEQFDREVMDALLDTEIAADEALQASEAGFIDGNEIGGHSYDLYFVGDDREVTWEILGPVFQRAPLRWTTVELRHGLDDPSPTVLTGP